MTSGKAKHSLFYSFIHTALSLGARSWSPMKVPKCLLLFHLIVVVCMLFLLLLLPWSFTLFISSLDFELTQCCSYCSNSLAPPPQAGPKLALSSRVNSGSIKGCGVNAPVTYPSMLTHVPKGAPNARVWWWALPGLIPPFQEPHQLDAIAPGAVFFILLRYSVRDFAFGQLTFF